MRSIPAIKKVTEENEKSWVHLVQNEAFDSFQYEVRNYLQQNFKATRILNFQNRSNGSGDVEIGFLANLRYLYLVVKDMMADSLCEKS